MKLLSCKREQKRLNRSFRKTRLLAGGFHRHIEAQNTYQDIVLHDIYISTLLESCDAMESLSQCLIHRYGASGIDHPHFVMIENGLPASFAEAKQEGYFQGYSAELNRFGYVGQLKPYKGVLLLLQAVALLQEQGVTDFTVSINGANLKHQPEEFRDKSSFLYENAKNRIILGGSYKQQDIKALLLEKDWVVMPSIWWERSPVVIHEFFCLWATSFGDQHWRNCREDRKQGALTYAVRSPSALAWLMVRRLRREALRQGLRRLLLPPYVATTMNIRTREGSDSHLKVNS
jgi:glycosyltransferase involved in cell wall biosynthesis